MNLIGARMRGVLLTDADIDGAMRCATVADVRAALTAVESMWAETLAGVGADPAATVTFDEAVAVHAGRLRRVGEFLAGATDDDLDRVRPANPAPGFPPPKERTARACLRVLFNEEREHHRFAVRDLVAEDPAG